MVKIEIYTKPGCGGCERLKEIIPGTELESITTYKTIKGKEGKPNLDFIKERGFDNIPVIHVFNQTEEEFLVGFHPLDKIREVIKNIDEV